MSKRRLRVKVNVMALKDVPARGCPLKVNGVDLLERSSAEAIKLLEDAGLVSGDQVALPAGTTLVEERDGEAVLDCEGTTVSLVLTPDVVRLFG